MEKLRIAQKSFLRYIRNSSALNQMWLKTNHQIANKQTNTIKRIKKELDQVQYNKEALRLKYSV